MAQSMQRAPLSPLLSRLLLLMASRMAPSNRLQLPMLRALPSARAISLPLSQLKKPTRSLRQMQPTQPPKRSPRKKRLINPLQQLTNSQRRSTSPRRSQLTKLRTMVHLPKLKRLLNRRNNPRRLLSKLRKSLKKSQLPPVKLPLPLPAVSLTRLSLSSSKPKQISRRQSKTRKRLSRWPRKLSPSQSSSDRRMRSLRNVLIRLTKRLV